MPRMDSPEAKTKLSGWVVLAKKSRKSGWHDHVGCYTKRKNKKKLKLFESWEIY